jgi:acyl-coenzyme A thioesterase PaaI-like protein
MELKILRKQENSRMCFACGLENSAGLKGSFYECEGGILVGRFSPKAEWQGYPGRLHGGMASTMLDECLSRVIMIGKAGETWGVTANLSLTFKEAIPLDGDIFVRARVVKEGGRVYEASGEILLADGRAAVDATGRFLKLPIAAIAGAEATSLYWRVSPAPDEPETLSIPG